MRIVTLPAPERVDLIEDIVRIGEHRAPGGIASLRELTKGPGVMAIVASAWEESGILDLGTGNEVSRSPYGDEVIADELAGFVQEITNAGAGLEALYTSLDEGAFSWPAQTIEQGSVVDALSDLTQDSVLKDNVYSGAQSLFYKLDPLDDLLKEPWRGRLADKPAVYFLLGLARLKHVSHSLMGGSAPSLDFADLERKVYLRIDDVYIRRRNRAWHLLCDLAYEDLVGTVDRAEELLPIWLMHPMPGEVNEYVRLLHRSYLAGHYPECVILGRAVLERLFVRLVPAKMKGGEPTLKKMEEYLIEHHVLDWEHKKLSQWLRKTGNGVVHGTPESVNREVALEAITNTLAVGWWLYAKAPDLLASPNE